MTPEEFRQAYFEQYSEEGDVCDDEWFAQYFDNSSDWLEVEFRSPKEGFVVYSDPESSIGGYWATTADGEIEGPFPSMSELAVALGYSPRNFPPDAEAEDFEDDAESEAEDDFDEFDDLDDEDLDVDFDEEEDEEDFDEED
jgi:hypothetical protein